MIYTKPRAEFDVTFYKTHLDVDWSLNYDEVHESHGLVGMLLENNKLIIRRYVYVGYTSILP